MGHAATVIDITHENRRWDDVAPSMAQRFWLVGIAGIAIAACLSLIPAFNGGDFKSFLSQFFRSYIIGLAFVASIALGALFFTMMQHLTRAGWSVVVRRLAETLAGQLSWVGLMAAPLLIPLLMNLPDVYEWSDPARVSQDATGLIAKKSGYLNDTFFIIRMVFYFAVWGWLGSFFLNKSVEQDLTGNDQLSNRMSAVAGPGILIYALTVTFFAFDLLMSITPHWFSTIFGVYYFAGCMVSFHSTMILLMMMVQRSGRVPNAITAEHYHDIGKFLFAFVVFWAYIGFSQYMLIWYANIPEETFWYAARQATPWWLGISILLLVGHFILPFVLLISRYPKRRPNLIWFGAIWMLVMHFVDLYYVVAPDTHSFVHHGNQADHMRPGWQSLLTDVPLTLGMLGLYGSLVVRELGRNALVPERDPRLNESLAFENF